MFGNNVWQIFQKQTFGSNISLKCLPNVSFGRLPNVEHLNDKICTFAKELFRKHYWGWMIFNYRQRNLGSPLLKIGKIWVPPLPRICKIWVP